MSLITTKQHRRHSIVDPTFILFFSALFVLVIFAVSTGNFSNLVEDVLNSFAHTTAGMSVNTAPSFASDQSYWAANCTSGWSSDSVCDVIASRTQSCEISDDSAYCSKYKDYLKQFSD